MARGDFLRGLSEGIFERQGQLRQEQEAKDFQSKQGVIQMLAGLSDSVEPESLPLLMGHIWDTMGIKKQSSGKGLRGFLDAFSGVPNRSVEDQLGTKLRSLTQGMVGPQTARDTRLKNNLAQKGIPGLMQAAPESAYGQQAAADAEGLKKKLVFRDPRQEKLGEIEARYGAQLENQRARQEESHAAAMQRLVTSHDLRTQENDRKNKQRIEFGVRQLALRMMMDPDIQAFPPHLREIAANQKAQAYLSEEAVSKGQLLDSRTELNQANAAKSRAETTPQGSRSSKVSADRFEYTKDTDRAKMLEDITKAEGAFKALKLATDESGTSLDATAKMFPGGMMTREQLSKSEYATMVGKIGDAVRKYNSDKQKMEAAQSEIDAKKKSLADFDAKYGSKKATPPAKATKGGKRAVAPVRPVGPVTSNPTGGETFDVTTPLQRKAYKIPETELDKLLPTLKGNWVVGETITEDGVRKVIVRLKE